MNSRTDYLVSNLIDSFHSSINLTAFPFAQKNVNNDNVFTRNVVKIKANKMNEQNEDIEEYQYFVNEINKIRQRSGSHYVNEISKNKELLDFILLKTEFLNKLNIENSLKFRIFLVLEKQFEQPRCPTCGKLLEFQKSKNRFKYHCNSSCASLDPNVKEKLEKTKLEKYGDRHFVNHKKQEETMNNKYGVKSALSNSFFREKGKQTKLEKYGSETFNNPEKTNKTCFERYGSGRNLNKIKETMRKKYGVESYLSSEYINSIRNNSNIQKKIQKTKRVNHTFNTSKDEEECFSILKRKFEEVKRQYKSEKYPFNCDFYIPSKDLYIECNFHWTHGGHTFDKNNPLDIEKLNKWIEKSKHSKFFQNAINVWTNLDQRKLKIAKENNIKYFIFWNKKDLITKIDNLI